jgi:hypothetical protein
MQGDMDMDNHSKSSPDKKVNKGYVRHLLDCDIFDTCEGCQQDPRICGIISTGNTEICPCIECLVKPICSHESCPEYELLLSEAMGCTQTAALILKDQLGYQS